MDTAFNVYIPLKKDFSGDDLTGIASTTSVDRDTEKMSEKALKEMETDIKTLGVNLFENHDHNWENTLGVVHDAQLVDKQLNVKIKLDDPVTNPKIPILLNKLARGIKLGLSVGGNVTATKWEYDRELGKKVKVIDGVKLYEISVVGIPSNADSFVSLPEMISKSMNKKPIVKSCPLCFTKNIKDVCPTCFYKSTELPIYKIKGKYYYRDARLGEYRNVDNPNDRMPIDSVDNSELEKPTSHDSQAIAGKKCPVCLYEG